MESQFELESAIRSLQMQMDEGIDEWILPRAQSRFEEAKQADARKKAPAKPHVPVQDKLASSATGQVNVVQNPKLAKSAADEKQAVDFSKLTTDEAITEALFDALPSGLRTTLNTPVDALGSYEAEVLMVVDAPHRDAIAAGSLEGDASFRLLRKSLQAIELDCDASLGKEPYAQVRFEPISPWRMPQDRKFTESEALIFTSALKARVVLGQYKAILLAGSNLAGLEGGGAQKRLFDLPSFSLVSPRVMLREPMLKRVHWQRLLKFRDELEEILKI